MKKRVMKHKKSNLKSAVLSKYGIEKNRDEKMKIKTLMSAVVACVITTGVHANNYGVVDIIQVSKQSVYLQAQYSTLEGTVKSEMAKLEAIGKELAAFEVKLNAKLSDAERKKLMEQYQVKAQQFTQQQQVVQQKNQSGLQNINNAFEAKVKTAAEQLRQEQKLDFVLNKNAVFAYDAKYDLTAKMVQKVNAMK